MIQITRPKLALAGISSLLCASFSLAAGAQLRINEVLLNPSGGDNGNEFVELISSEPNFNLNGVKLLVIEGDEGAANGGVGRVDNIFDYTGFTTGTNRLFLHRDAATILNPAPDTATPVFISDFIPDLENNTITLLLVKLTDDSIIFEGTDLDADNDGLIDQLYLDEIEVFYDAFGWIEGNTLAEKLYAVQPPLINGINFVPPTPPIFSDPDYDMATFVRLPNGSVFGATSPTGATPGPFAVLGTTRQFNPLGQRTAYEIALTPGSHNPEPTVLVSGVIALEDCLVLDKPVTLEFRTGIGDPFSVTVTPDAITGAYTVTGIPAQSYDVFIKPERFLSRLLTLDLSGGLASSLTTSHRGGDANNDNLVAVEDLAALIEAFDADPTSPNWNNGIADFNCDDLVSVDDLDILIRNFDAEGEA